MSSFQILTVWITLATIFSLTSSAPSNALELSENKFKIELIDVKCDKNEDGMHVTIQFAQPFDGIIYSQRYISDPKCRYVSAGESEKTFNFVVPYEGCGSKPSCAICDSIDNVLIIQQDEEVQDMLDVVTVPTAHGGVDCWMDIQRGTYPDLMPVGNVIRIGEALTVLVYLRDQQKQYDLSVRNCWAYDGEQFDDEKTGKVQLSDASGCTMKRKLFGSWQKTPETGSSGATLLLHNILRAFKFPDESQIYLKCDIEICRDTCAEAICDADEIDSAVDPLNTKCIKDKAIENKAIERSGSSIGFTTLPNKSQQSRTVSSITTRKPFIVTTKRPFLEISTTERSFYTSTILTNRETTQVPETTTSRDAITEKNQLQTSIKPGYDSFCNRYPNSSQRVTEDLGNNIEILTFRPPKPFATVKYQQTTIAPKSNVDCDLNSNDYRCKENEITSTPETTRESEPPLICIGEALDPRCPNPTPTITPPTYLPPSTTTKITATRFETSTLPTVEFTTFQPTTKQPTTTKTPKNKFFICVPDSNDVNCDYESSKTTEEPTTTESTTNESTTKVPITTTVIPSLNQFTTKKPVEKPICTIGSTNPECRKVSTNTLNLKPSSVPKVPPTQGVISSTRPPVCYPGALDPRCARPTTRKVPRVVTSTFKPIPEQKSVPDQIPVVVVPACYPGSPDPVCSTTTKKPIIRFTTTTRSTTTRGTTTTSGTTASPRTTVIPQTVFKVSSTTRAPICYPGSLDPRCTTSTTIKSIVQSIGTIEEVNTETPTSTTVRFIPSSSIAPRCYPGSFDPKCAPSTTQRTTAPTTTSRIPTVRIGTKYVSSTTTAPRCFSGSLDPKCATTQKTSPPTTFTTTSRIPTVRIGTNFVSSTTAAPQCYFGSRDPRCRQTTTQKPVPIGTASQVTTKTPETSIQSSLDPKCIKSISRTGFTTRVPQITAKAIIISTPRPQISSTTRAPVCYPGALDPRCATTTTTKKAVPSVDTRQEVTTEVPSSTTAGFIPSSSITPRCYPGSFDPKCAPSTTQRTTVPTTTSRIPTVRIGTKYVSSTTTAPRCYIGSLDPRCAQSSTTQRATNVFSTTLKPIFGSQQPQFKCLPGSTDPRCSENRVGIPLRCGPGTPLDPRCPNPTPTAEPATYLPPFISTAVQSTKPPIYTSTTAIPFKCAPNSLHPRCRGLGISTNTFGSVSTSGLRTTSTISAATDTKSIPTSTSSILLIRSTVSTTSTTTTQRPTTPISTFSFPPFTTKRIFSSPQPFTTRPPTVSSTTENLLCYTGSKDKRCPQLPSSFSTRQPATYLPPFPDVRFNRVKRQTTSENEQPNEIVKFSLSFKPFSFS